MSTSTAGRSTEGRPALTVPRRLFLPELVWRHDMATGRSTPVDRRTDPDAWQAAADSDDPIVTQWDDGAHHGTAPGRVPTSSSSAPSVVRRMLDCAQLAPGMRVLEIGTGTGWTAALMAASTRVTTIEVDPAVYARARTALDDAGFHPTVVCADGTHGYPPGAPYDRVIATAGVRTIPAAWLAQTVPGGLIVMPWGTAWSNSDLLLRLQVDGDGSAAGRFHGQLEFMKLRDQRVALPRFQEGPVEESTTAVVQPPHGRWDAWTAVAGLYLPGVMHAVQPGESQTLWLYALDGSAWASADLGTGRVRQMGARQLWDDYENALAAWHAAGDPGPDRFGLAVTPGQQLPWLDEPANLLH